MQQGVGFVYQPWVGMKNSWEPFGGQSLLGICVHQLIFKVFPYLSLLQAVSNPFCSDVHWTVPSFWNTPFLNIKPQVLCRQLLKCPGSLALVSASSVKGASLDGNQKRQDLVAFSQRNISILLWSLRLAYHIARLN